MAFCGRGAPPDPNADGAGVTCARFLRTTRCPAAAISQVATGQDHHDVASSWFRARTGGAATVAEGTAGTAGTVEGARGGGREPWLARAVVDDAAHLAHG